MKPVGNVTVSPRDMHSDRQKHQLDYFQMYAVKDRIDFSDFSEEPPLINLHAPLHELLPTAEDDKIMLSDFGILIARIIPHSSPLYFLMWWWNISRIFTQVKFQPSQK